MGTQGAACDYGLEWHVEESPVLKSYSEVEHDYIN